MFTTIYIYIFSFYSTGLRVVALFFYEGKGLLDLNNSFPDVSIQK